MEHFRRFSTCDELKLKFYDHKSLSYDVFSLRIWKNKKFIIKADFGNFILPGKIHTLNGWILSAICALIQNTYSTTAEFYNDFYKLTLYLFPKVVEKTA